MDRLEDADDAAKLETRDLQKLVRKLRRPHSSFLSEGAARAGEQPAYAFAATDAALHSAQTKADSDRRAAHALIDSLGLSS